MPSLFPSPILVRAITESTRHACMSVANRPIVATACSTLGDQKAAFRRTQFRYFPRAEKIGPGAMEIPAPMARSWSFSASTYSGHSTQRMYPPAGRETRVPFGKCFPTASAISAT